MVPLKIGKKILKATFNLEFSTVLFFPNSSITLDIRMSVPTMLVLITNVCPSVCLFLSKDAQAFLNQFFNITTTIMSFISFSSDCVLSQHLLLLSCCPDNIGNLSHSTHSTNSTGNSSQDDLTSGHMTRT